jgi:hypothetical protein
MTTPNLWPRRLPCTRGELEALRATMFAFFTQAERDENCLRGFLLTGYAVELAVLLAERGTGLQERFKAWHRGTPPFKVGWLRGRRPGRRHGGQLTRHAGTYGNGRRAAVRPAPAPRRA